MRGRLPDRARTSAAACSTSFTGRPTALRRHRRERDVRPRRTLAAEAAADERIDRRARSPARGRTILRQRGLHAADVLGRVVERQLRRRSRPRSWRAAPSGCGARSASCRPRRPSLPPRARPSSTSPRDDRSARDWPWAADKRCALGRIEVEPGLGRRVDDTDKARRLRRALERVGDDDGDRLAVVRDDVVLQQRQHAARRRLDAALAGLRQARRVHRREDREHAGRGLRGGDVHAHDARRSATVLVTITRVSDARHRELGRVGRPAARP